MHHQDLRQIVRSITTVLHLHSYRVSLKYVLPSYLLYTVALSCSTLHYSNTVRKLYYSVD